MAHSSGRFHSMPSTHLRLDKSKCGKCKKELANLRFLPCSHGSCHQCLVDICCAGDDHKKVTCPNCKRTVPLPENGIMGFPSVFGEDEDANILKGIGEVTVHKCDHELNFYCQTCDTLICKECVTLLPTCENHVHVPLAQASKIHQMSLRGNVELLRTKQKEVLDQIEEINGLHRRVYAGQASLVKDQDRGQHLEEMVEKICGIRKELYEISVQIIQAMKEVDKLLESGNDHLISGKFANLHSNLERLIKMPLRRLTSKDLVELDHAGVPKVAAQKDGTYEVKGADTLRLVIVGLTGHGKSSIANTILAPHFLSQEVPKYGRSGKWGVVNYPLQVSASFESVTAKCDRVDGHVLGRTVTLIDTPGFCDTTRSYESTIHEITRCMYLTVPGPHTLLLVVRIGRCTDDVIKSVNMMKAIFGEECVKYAIVVFTGADELLRHNETIKDIIRKIPDGAMQDLLQECEYRYVSFNNVLEDLLSTTNQDQIEKLLSVAETIAQKNGGKCYTNDIFANAKKIVAETMKIKDEEIKKEVREREEIERAKEALEKKLEEMQKEKTMANKEKAQLQQEVDHLKLDLRNKDHRIQQLQQIVGNPNQIADDAAAKENQQVKEDLKKKVPPEKQKKWCKLF